MKIKAAKPFDIFNLMCENRLRLILRFLLVFQFTISIAAGFYIPVIPPRFVDAPAGQPATITQPQAAPLDYNSGCGCGELCDNKMTTSSDCGEQQYENNTDDNGGNSNGNGGGVYPLDDSGLQTELVQQIRRYSILNINAGYGSSGNAGYGSSSAGGDMTARLAAASPLPALSAFLLRQNVVPDATVKHNCGDDTKNIDNKPTTKCQTGGYCRLPAGECAEHRSDNKDDNTKQDCQLDKKDDIDLKNIDKKNDDKNDDNHQKQQSNCYGSCMKSKNEEEHHTESISNDNNYNNCSCYSSRQQSNNSDIYSGYGKQMSDDNDVDGTTGCDCDDCCYCDDYYCSEINSDQDSPPSVPYLSDDAPPAVRSGRCCCFSSCCGERASEQQFRSSRQQQISNLTQSFNNGKQLNLKRNCCCCNSTDGKNDLRNFDDSIAVNDNSTVDMLNNTHTIELPLTVISTENSAVSAINYNITRNDTVEPPAFSINKAEIKNTVAEAKDLSNTAAKPVKAAISSSNTIAGMTSSANVMPTVVDEPLTERADTPRNPFAARNDGMGASVGANALNGTVAVEPFTRSTTETMPVTVEQATYGTTAKMLNEEFTMQDITIITNSATTTTTSVETTTTITTEERTVSTAMKDIVSTIPITLSVSLTEATTTVVMPSIVVPATKATTIATTEKVEKDNVTVADNASILQPPQNTVKNDSINATTVVFLSPEISSTMEFQAISSSDKTLNLQLNHASDIAVGSNASEPSEVKSNELHEDLQNGAIRRVVKRRQCNFEPQKDSDNPAKELKVFNALANSEGSSKSEATRARETELSANRDAQVLSSNPKAESQFDFESQSRFQPNSRIRSFKRASDPETLTSEPELNRDNEMSSSYADLGNGPIKIYQPSDESSVTSNAPKNDKHEENDSDKTATESGFHMVWLSVNSSTSSPETQSEATNGRGERDYRKSIDHAAAWRAVPSSPPLSADDKIFVAPSSAQHSAVEMGPNCLSIIIVSWSTLFIMIAYRLQIKF